MKTFGTKTSAGNKRPGPAKAPQTKNNHRRNNGFSTDNQAATSPSEKNRTSSLGKQLGAKVGNVADTKNKVMDKAKAFKDNVKNAPTNAKYSLYKGKRDFVKNVQDFSENVGQTKATNQRERLRSRNTKRANIANKRLEMDRARQQKKETMEPYASMQKLKNKNRQPAVPPKRRIIIPKEDVQRIRAATQKSSPAQAKQPTSKRKKATLNGSVRGHRK